MKSHLIVPSAAFADICMQMYCSHTLHGECKALLEGFPFTCTALHEPMQWSLLRHSSPKCMSECVCKARSVVDNGIIYYVKSWLRRTRERRIAKANATAAVFRWCLARRMCYTITHGAWCSCRRSVGSSIINLRLLLFLFTRASARTGHIYVQRHTHTHMPNPLEWK